ncbi:MAG: chemotaxis protein CheD [Nanoarchaeota archaeon]
MTNEIIVGMGKFFVVDQPATLTCLGLGSCVGLMLYDERKKISGLAHIMLPDSNRSKIPEINYNSILAEEDERIQATIKNSLVSCGYEVNGVFNNKNDFIRNFQKNNTYLVVLDSKILQKSEDNCIIEEILSINKTTNIIVTNVASSTDYIDLLSRGVVDVISIPVTQKKSDFVFSTLKELRQIRFADVAIEKMIQRMLLRGSSLENIKAKVAGGGNMFNHSQVDHRNIGEENQIAVHEILNEKGISIISKDVGGNTGRTVRFDTVNFKAVIKSRDGEKTI